LSTTWACGTYSDNHDGWEDGDRWKTFMESDEVEIMILEAPDKLIKKINKKYNGSGSVIGYLTMKQWLEIIELLSK